MGKRLLRGIDLWKLDAGCRNLFERTHRTSAIIMTETPEIQSSCFVEMQYAKPSSHWALNGKEVDGRA